MKIPGAIINPNFGVTCSDLECPERKGGLCHFDPRYQEENPEKSEEPENYESKRK